MYIWNPKKGGLAHLARALAWQARGDRFESGILHQKGSLIGCPFFLNFTQHDKQNLFSITNGIFLFTV
jgi:hypothetical protein